MVLLNEVKFNHFYEKYMPERGVYDKECADEPTWFSHHKEHSFNYPIVLAYFNLLNVAVLIFIFIK